MDGLRIGCLAVLLAVLTLPFAGQALAQSDVCLRLEARLTALDSRAADVDKSRALEKQIRDQSDELDQATGEARRAVFMLAQSGRPEAQATVVRVARTGPAPVRVAAVRELARFGGPDVSGELLDVYSTADLPVKRQVVSSLGERAERTALLRIVEKETDPQLRASAIVTLGQAGGRDQLRVLYQTASGDARRAIIVGLFNARAEDDLIRIAGQERDARLRAEAISYLRLLGTPKAKAFLEKAGASR